MDGLVLPVVVFLAICLALALIHTRGRGAVPVVLRAWDALRVRKLLQLELPRSHYTILQDVQIPGDRESIHIDHLVISAYGIFAIKQVGGSGTIVGKPSDARWFRIGRRNARSFPNPLFECVAAVNALRSLLDLDARLLNFVLVFTGDVKFSSPMPVNVTRLDGLPLFIEGRDKLLIDFDELPKLVDRIHAARPALRLLRNPIRAATS